MEVEESTSTTKKEGKSTTTMMMHGGGGDDVHHSLKRKKRNRRRLIRNICFGLIAVILAVALIMLILGLTIFKAKHPVTTVNSLSLDDLDLSLDIARLSVHLNVTVHVDLSIKNPNKVGFKYTNSSALLKYRDQVVGQVPLPAGKIRADGTTPLNLTLTVMADRLLSDSNLYSDAISGTLPLTTYTRISGKVGILRLFNIRVVSYSTCELNIDVFNRRLANQSCQYKNKL